MSSDQNCYGVVHAREHAPLKGQVARGGLSCQAFVTVLYNEIMHFIGLGPASSNYQLIPVRHTSVNLKSYGNRVMKKPLEKFLGRCRSDIVLNVETGTNLDL